MYRRILIPLDGSPIAEQVLPLARMFVVHFQSSVVLFEAVEPIANRARVQGAALRAQEQSDRSRTQALEYLEKTLHDFPAGVSVEREVRVGSPAAAILDFAESAQVDLIAMATHGRTGLQRWVYGSVAEKVLSGAQHPLVLVRARENPPPLTRIKRILVPLDGSELSERALGPVRNVATAFAAEVLLLQVMELAAYPVDGLSMGVYTSAVDDAVRESTEEYLSQTARRLQLQGVHVRWQAQWGQVTQAILDTAQKEAANLIVMCTHGRSGAGRWIMGSVADRVLRASHIPVLLIRSGMPEE
jgi:nucleotide-binding universal stress UspA family protein